MRAFPDLARTKAEAARMFVKGGRRPGSLLDAERDAERDVLNLVELRAAGAVSKTQAAEWLAENEPAREAFHDMMENGRMRGCPMDWHCVERALGELRASRPFY